MPLPGGEAPLPLGGSREVAGGARLAGPACPSPRHPASPAAETEEGEARGEEAEALAAGVAALGLPLPPSGAARLLAFLAELRRWNRAYNLVADAPPLAWVRTHLLDSLTIADPLRVLAVEAGHLAVRSAGERSRAGSTRPQGGDVRSPRGEPRSREREDLARSGDGGPEVRPRTESPPSPDHPVRAGGPFRVLDLGSGAGLPGIPLAIALPELRFTLLDGNGKKARFCRHAVTALGLPNVEVAEERAERYAPPAPFDAAVARAVGSLARVRALLRPRCRGPILVMKGRCPAHELEALRGVPAETVPLRVPGLEAERHLVVLR